MTGFSDNLSASSFNSSAQAAPNNSGFGGGGVSHINASTDGTFNGAAGGSGIVILRYPSYQAAARATTGGPQTYVTGPWRVYVFTASGTITF